MFFVVDGLSRSGKLLLGKILLSSTSILSQSYTGYFERLVETIYFDSLDKHSIPKDPEPENKSKIVEFFRFMFIFFECSRRLKIDSFTKSFKGLVFLSLGNNNFFPLNLPEIILITI